MKTMIIYVPYVKVTSNTYRRLPWAMEEARAVHSLLAEVNRQTKGQAHVKVPRDSLGGFCRNCQGNIVLYDTTFKRWGYIKEIKCSTLSIAHQHRTQPVTA